MCLYIKSEIQGADESENFSTARQVDNLILPYNNPIKKMITYSFLAFIQEKSVASYGCFKIWSQWRKQRTSNFTALKFNFLYLC